MTHPSPPHAPTTNGLAKPRPASAMTRRKSPPRVVAPYDVRLPHPETDMQEMRVPASINGTSLATGRL